MFELSFVKKYLTPKRNQLSVSLIGLLSVGVISLVVWLVLVFLSVTEGIERNWLHKLTALNAPVKVQPTQKYYASYYYKVDQYSASAGYAARTIGEKARGLLSDPYNAELDESLPRNFPSPDKDSAGDVIDPVKRAYSALSSVKKDFSSLAYQDFEMSGAMLRINMIRPEFGPFSDSTLESESQLTQVTYLSSFCEENPHLNQLLLPPTLDELNGLFYQAMHPGQNELFTSLARSVEIDEVKTATSLFSVPLELLPEKVKFQVSPYRHQKQIIHAVFSDQGSEQLWREGQALFVNGEKVEAIPLFINAEMHFKASFASVEKPLLKIEGQLQGKKLEGIIPWKGVKLSKARAVANFSSPPQISPPWAYSIENGKKILPDMNGARGILLTKQMRDSGVRLGDQGHINYPSQSASSVQEMKVPVFVAGFYDPGFLAIGAKAAIAPKEIVTGINATQSAFSVDRTKATGIQVWTKELQEAEAIKTQLIQTFEKEGIAPFWTVSTFREYDFAKDLMQQFESDKYLFTLVGAIILFVACCNIISLLVLLVNNKKKEIGILAALGARKRSVALIFGLCGAFIGLISSLIGIALAKITLLNIDVIARFLSFIQGHQAFNALFFGSSLPKELSNSAALFVLIITPLLSILAGLVPAIKAAKMKPSEILRGN